MVMGYDPAVVGVPVKATELALQTIEHIIPGPALQGGQEVNDIPGTLPVSVNLYWFNGEKAPMLAAEA